MSGFLPVGTTLQLSDSSGNINHQGILTSSVNGTPLLGGTFPTTSTGASTCHAHYTDASSNALKFLNASAGGVGGHEFWVSTSTNAPIKTAQFDVDGLTIDKSSISTPPIYSPNVLLLAPDGKNIELASDINVAPYNFHLQTFNPVYMTQTTSYYTAGDLCYAVAGSGRVIQIFNNNNTTNPIPPNVVPTGFTNGDNTNVGITTGIPLFTLSPIVPSTIKTSNLSDILTLTDNSDESILTASDLTFNGVSVALKPPVDELIIKQTNLIYQFASPAIYADGRPMIATPTTIINTYGINAWYFKNSFASGVNKINWYIAPDNGMVVGDILGLYLRFFNVSTTSNDNTMFLTVYTKLQASGNYASWYHSNITYTLDSSITPVVNTNYTMFMNVSTTCPNPSYYATTLVPMQISSVAPNPKGTYDPTDEILAFSIGTNSASPINSVEFVLQKFGIMTTTKGTQEFQFAPLI